jgi:hypothetical protein
VWIPITRLLLEISRKLNDYDHWQFVHDIHLWVILCEITTSLHRTECFKLRESDHFDSPRRIPQMRDVNSAVHLYLDRLPFSYHTMHKRFRDDCHNVFDTVVDHVLRPQNFLEERDRYSHKYFRIQSQRIFCAIFAFWRLQNVSIEIRDAVECKEKEFWEGIEGNRLSIFPNTISMAFL